MKINDQVHLAAVKYFESLGALFVPSPIVTGMISSPGALQGWRAISYTDEVAPVKLRWFDLTKEVFLTESCQIYLELALMNRDINHVYSITPSFRKEETDTTHLSSFYHIEYEGHVQQKQNVKIAIDLIRNIISQLLEKNRGDLKVFLDEKDIQQIEHLLSEEVHHIRFIEALDILYKDTGDKKYKPFTIEHYGPWEEVRLTEILGGMVVVSEFPILEVPFYHAQKNSIEPFVADNSDIIWPGYREIVGSGHRVRNLVELQEKAKIFKLPRADYEPYFRTRKFANYQETSGFGLGWERLLQGLLKMPRIVEVAMFPRVHWTIRP